MNCRKGKTMKVRKIFKEAAKQVRKNGVNAFITICDDEAVVEFTLSDNYYDEDGMINEISIDLDALHDAVGSQGSKKDNACGCHADESAPKESESETVDFDRLCKSKLLNILDKLEHGIDETNKRLS